MLDDGASSTTVAAERLDVLDADVLVVVVPDGFEGDVAGNAVLEGLPVVQRVGPVQLDAADVGGAMACDTVLSAETVVDEVVPRLSDALRA